MAEEKMTVATYIFPDGKTINMDHLENIRNIYKDLTKFDELEIHAIDRKALANVCQQLNLINDKVDSDYLELCLASDDITTVRLELKAQHEASSISGNNTDKEKRNVSSSASQQHTLPIVLNEILCVLSKKMDTVEIKDFINNLLFQQIQRQSLTTNEAST
jgi:hypothetical protein